MPLQLTCSQEEFGKKILKNIVGFFDEYDKADSKASYLSHFFHMLEAYVDDDILADMYGSTDKVDELKSEIEALLRADSDKKLEKLGYDPTISSTIFKLKGTLFGKLFASSFLINSEKKLRWISNKYKIFDTSVLMAYISKDKANSFVFRSDGIRSICKINGENVEYSTKYDELLGSILYKDGAIYVNDKYVICAPLNEERSILFGSSDGEEAKLFVDIFIKAVKSAIDDCCE